MRVRNFYRKNDKNLSQVKVMHTIYFSHTSRGIKSYALHSKSNTLFNFFSSLPDSIEIMCCMTMFGDQSNISVMLPVMCVPPPLQLFQSPQASATACSFYLHFTIVTRVLCTFSKCNSNRQLITVQFDLMLCQYQHHITVCSSSSTVTNVMMPMMQRITNRNDSWF